MTTRGKIRKINKARLMVAVDAKLGISIFEMYTDREINVGDDVSWSGDTPTGDTTLMNHTKNERFDVYFQNHFVSPEYVDKQLRII